MSPPPEPPSTLPFPLNHLYDSASLLADSILDISDRLSQISDGISSTSPSTSQSPPDPIIDMNDVEPELSDVADFHHSVHQTLNQIMNGELKPPQMDSEAHLTDAGPTNFSEAVAAFVTAINWEEDGYWIYSLIAAQLLVFVLCVSVKRRTDLQLCMFIVVCALVYVTERFNSLLSLHHSKFSSQDYFDKSGFFAATFIAGPLLISAVAIVFNLVKEASDLLVKVKVKELKSKSNSNSSKNSSKNKKNN
jgi:hypothetical protein